MQSVSDLALLEEMVSGEPRKTPRALPLWVPSRLAFQASAISGIGLTGCNLAQWWLGLNVLAWVHLVTSLAVLVTGTVWWGLHYREHGRYARGPIRWTGWGQSVTWLGVIGTGLAFIPLMGDGFGVSVLRYGHGALFIAGIVLLRRHIGKGRANPA